MKASEYVAAVADDLKANGWVQHTLSDHRGSCILGAMVRALDQDVIGLGPVSREAHVFVMAELERRGFDTIPHFNDAEGRTLSEVLDFLHECQIGLKEKE